MKLFDNITPTLSYSDNQKSVTREVARRGASSIWVEYTKGNETSIQIQQEISNVDDTEGSEDWMKQAVVDNSGNVTLAPDYSFGATGKYRVDLPTTVDEDKVRLSVKRTGGTSNSSLVVQDLTYTAVQMGTGGNAISIAYVVSGLNTPLSVGVVGSAITVHLQTNGSGNSISTATQVKNAVDTFAPAHALVTVAITGVGSNVQVAAAPANLSGGGLAGTVTVYSE